MKLIQKIMFTVLHYGIVNPAMFLVLLANGCNPYKYDVEIVFKRKH